MDSHLVSHPGTKHTPGKEFFDLTTPTVETKKPNKADSDILPELMTQLLQKGHRVRFRAPGKSMQPAVLDGDVLIIEPVEPGAVKTGDIILYKAEQRLVAHRVKSIEKIKYRTHNPFKLGTGAAHTPLNASDNQDNQPAAENLYAFILRGDATYSYDEPVYADQILGKAVAIERNENTINPNSIFYKLACKARTWAARLKRIFS